MDFVYWLAFLLGYANPMKMLDEMEPYQLNEWANFLSENKELLWPKLI